MRTWIVTGLVLAACNRSDGELEPRAPARPPLPERVAAEDKDLRVMVAEVAAAKACEMIRGQYRPLRAADRPDVVTGALWLRECKITQRGTKVTLRLGGRGWQWTDQQREKAGATFEVRQYVRFDADVTIAGALDLAYSRKTHVLSIWFSPSKAPDVDFTPIGDIDVDEQGAWATIVGTLGSVFAQSPEAKAEQAAEATGVREFQKKFSEGMTVTVDLCKGLPRFNLGRPAQGKMVDADAGETRKVPVELHPGGVMAFGPYPASEGMTVRARVRAGSARLEIVCADDAEALIGAYLEGGNASVPVERLAGKLVREEGAVKVKRARCPVVVLARPVGESTVPVTLEWERPEAEAAPALGGPLIDC